MHPVFSADDPRLAGRNRAPETTTAALRRAQLSLRAEKLWESPYFWAGFVLQGDWR